MPRMPIPVISVAQMREWERVTWASGQKEETVMRRAGEAVARHAERMTKAGDRILILAGKGHNGDDARFAAESMREREVRLTPVSDVEKVTKDFPSLLASKPALIIDGLFGIGLNRALGSPWLRLVQLINASHVPVLAVDVPSGLNADTGEPLENAVRATMTITFGAVKQGFLKPPAWPFVGKLEVAADIGLVPYPFETEVCMVTAEDFDGFPPARPVAGHKGTFGHVTIIAGSLGYHGAAVLAARGAQRAQPGLITLTTAPEVYVPIAQQLQSVMVHPWKDGNLPESCTAILAGPGLAAKDVPAGLQDEVRRLWKESKLPMVTDASALGWLAAGPTASALRVITPHPGEAARMLENTTAEVQADRVTALRQLSRRFGGCYVALKGHQTLMGRERDELFVNSSGNPHLAQGGSGDLLAGYLAGLLAQPGLQADAGKTLRYAVWQHGAAADALLERKPNWTVEELADALGTAA